MPLRRMGRAGGNGAAGPAAGGNSGSITAAVSRMRLASPQADIRARVRRDPSKDDGRGSSNRAVGAQKNSRRKRAKYSLPDSSSSEEGEEQKKKKEEEEEESGPESDGHGENAHLQGFDSEDDWSEREDTIPSSPVTSSPSRRAGRHQQVLSPIPQNQADGRGGPRPKATTTGSSKQTILSVEPPLRNGSRSRMLPRPASTAPATPGLKRKRQAPPPIAARTRAASSSSIAASSQGKSSISSSDGEHAFPNANSDLDSENGTNSKAGGRRSCLRQGLGNVFISDLDVFGGSDDDENPTRSGQRARPSASREPDDHEAERGPRRSGSRLTAEREGSEHRSCNQDIELEEDESDGEAASIDADGSEDERLLTRALSWQLHRLKKRELVRLHRLAGTWNDDAKVDPDLYTKQELVDGIIVARSRNNKNLSPSSVKTIHRSRSQSLSRSGSESSALSATPRRPTRQASPRSPIHTTSQADATLRLSPRQQRAKERKVSLEAAYETDAANEGGGEETEAEPPTTAGDIRRAAKRADTDAARRRKTALLEFPEQASPGLARYKKLRGRSTSMPGQGSQDRASAMRDALRASAAKGRRSGDSSDPFASGASEGTPLARRLRRSNSTMFLASSPIRTRARSRNQSGPVRRRPVTRCSTSAVEIFGDSARTPRPKRRGGSGKHVAFRNQDRESEVGHEGESSDGWDGMPVDDAPRDGQIKEADRLGARARSTPQRRAKTRAQETMQVDSSTEDELNLIRDSAVDMQDVNGPAEKSDEESSIDEDTPVKAWASRTARDAKANGRTSGSGSRKLTRRSAGSPQDSTPNSWMSTSSSGNDKSADEDYEGSDAENSASQSPSKARRLRNGKVRLSPPVEAGEPEPERDTEEEEEAEEEEAKRSDASGLPNGDVEMADAAAEEEDPMTLPAPNTLARLRRAQLVELCTAREIEIEEDDKKADLIATLMNWYNTKVAAEQGDLSSSVTAKPSSSSSTSTARPSGSDASGTGRKRGKSRRSKKYDTPLLLRSHENEVVSCKPPSPPLTANNQDAAPAEVVDELNGLDLESLNLVDKEIPPSKLEKLEKIGSGGFKDVYVGKYHISKSRVNKVAIADIRDHLTEMDIKELSLLRDLRHENIVRFIGVSIPEDPRNVPCMIVSELCSNGDLFDYIRNVEPPGDDEVFRILLETARGLEYLHTRTPAIIHRDCKSTNVLITKNRTAKINDFGLARVKNTTRSMMRSLVGTVNWQAVELWVPKPNYNEKVDVWSAAMTFWETLQWHRPEKKYPFQGMNEHQIYLDVGQKKHRPYVGGIRRQYGSEIVDLLDRMWAHDPRDRPTMTEVCNELEDLIKMKKAAVAAQKGK